MGPEDLLTLPSEQQRYSGSLGRGDKVVIVFVFATRDFHTNL